MILIEVLATPRAIRVDGPVVLAASDADVVLPIGKIRLRLTEAVDGITVEDLGGRHPLRTVEVGAVLKLGSINIRLSLINSREYELLLALRAAPSDTATRSIYADWLEEQGRPKHAEYLRAQLAAAAATVPTDPEFQTAASRVRRLANDVEPEWRAAVGMVFVEHCPVRPNRHAYPPFRDDVHGLELVCPMKWEQLAPTANPKVRACGVCQKDVTLCTTSRELYVLGQAGQCVAVELSDSQSRVHDGMPFAIGAPTPR